MTGLAGRRAVAADIYGDLPVLMSKWAAPCRQTAPQAKRPRRFPGGASRFALPDLTLRRAHLKNPTEGLLGFFRALGRRAGHGGVEPNLAAASL